MGCEGFRGFPLEKRGERVSNHPAELVASFASVWPFHTRKCCYIFYTQNKFASLAKAMKMSVEDLVDQVLGMPDDKLQELLDEHFPFPGPVPTT